MLFDPDLFHAGEVWEWCGGLYLLLYFERERSMYTTIKSENQQTWFALDLQSGHAHEIRMHTNARGDRWTRVA